jgi:hypothetical protein
MPLRDHEKASHKGYRRFWVDAIVAGLQNSHNQKHSPVKFTG